MKRIIMVGATAALAGVAAAASIGAHALTQAQVAFYHGYPGSGGTLVAKMRGAAAMQASAKQAIEHADSAVVTLSGHTATFSLDAAARAQGRALFDVKGVAKAASYDTASLAAVVKDMALAESGRQPLVVLSRTQGKGRVVLAFFHPDGGNAGIRVRNADHATIWVGGRPHRYAVSADAGSGLLSSIRLGSPGGSSPLSATVANLQTQLTLGSLGGKNASKAPSSGSSSSGGGSAEVGAGAGVHITVGGGG